MNASDAIVRLRSHPVLGPFLCPDRVARCRQLVPPRPGLEILDVGCGNHSVGYFRALYPEARYTGLDREEYETSEADLRSMDAFLRIDLETGSLDAIPDGHFDLVVAAHVIEHLRNGIEVAAALGEKLRPGGVLYLAYPRAESVDFPHRSGSLNFFDDPTHVTVIRTDALRAALETAGLRIELSGVHRSARSLGLMLVKVAASPLLGGVSGPMLWPLYGFEELTVAFRPA